MVRRPVPWSSSVGALAVTLAAVLGACGSSGPADDGASATTGPSAPPATATTGAGPADALSAPAVDACGNDLADLRSTVWAIDPATGAVRWSTPVPLADDYLLRGPAGDPVVPLERRSVEVQLDLGSGAVVATPPAGAHEVLLEPGPDASGSAVLLVDGERQPSTVTVGGVEVSAAGATGQTTIGLTGTDAASAPLWRVELGAADQIASLSPPVVFDGTVVVVASPPRPPCP